MPEAPQSKPQSSVVGQQGETLVSQWLQQQGWSILARGWTSRWGELDIVALRQEKGGPCLAFVEVKTRSRGNWDEDGLSAITPSKQAKLWKTAQLFLTKHPHLAEAICRFDVALVNVRRSPSKTTPTTAAKIDIGQPLTTSGYDLTLHTYLESAFERSY
ncbi:YraN family protein [Altericista sp. CCNU0014]|uniref:YraN family protein n=1 Tax=Altericista sp. CCNU0014 TaxID=3082949 RepID=UPI00385087A4